jgi:hypothetical protein
MRAHASLLPGLRARHALHRRSAPAAQGSRTSKPRASTRSPPETLFPPAHLGPTLQSVDLEVLAPRRRAASHRPSRRPCPSGAREYRPRATTPRRSHPEMADSVFAALRDLAFFETPVEAASFGVVTAHARPPVARGPWRCSATRSTAGTSSCMRADRAHTSSSGRGSRRTIPSWASRWCAEGPVSGGVRLGHAAARASRELRRAVDGARGPPSSSRIAASACWSSSTRSTDAPRASPARHAPVDDHAAPRHVPARARARRARRVRPVAGGAGGLADLREAVACDSHALGLRWSRP